MHREAGRSRAGSRDDKLGTGARRERVLHQLCRDAGHMSEEELAARIASGDERPETVPEEEVRDIHVALRHFDLPKAAAAGLVTWDPEERTVRPAPDADLSETEFRQLFADGWDEAAGAAEERRWTTIDVLMDREECGVRELAAAVAAREADGEPGEDDVEAVAVALHHRHLPKLADAGVVEYDPETGAVAYLGESGSRWWESPPAPPEPRGRDEPLRR